MPTILMVQGWRFFFYANEGNEPMHVHAVKGDADCKYWIYADRFDIEEEFEYNCSPRLRREVRRIIFTHFDEICTAWRGQHPLGAVFSHAGPSELARAKPRGDVSLRLRNPLAATRRRPGHRSAAEIRRSKS